MKKPTKPTKELKRRTVSMTSDKLKGLTLDQVTQKYHPKLLVASLVREALKELGHRALASYEFRSAAGVNPHQLNAVRDLFADHIVSVKERGERRDLWCGTKEFAELVRQSLED